MVVVVVVVLLSAEDLTAKHYLLSRLLTLPCHAPLYRIVLLSVADRDRVPWDYYRISSLCIERERYVSDSYRNNDTWTLNIYLLYVVWTLYLKVLSGIAEFGSRDGR